jgi:hypothetical protein
MSETSPVQQPFIINDNSKIDNTLMITTNLYPGIVPIHNINNSEKLEPGEIITNGYMKTPNNGGYIKVPYISPGGISKPNATYVDDMVVKYYKTSIMYIFKASHSIENTSYDAEMVVEMIPTTNPGEKLYLCFLLKCYRDNKKPLNDIDNIILNSDKSLHYKRNNFNLEPLIEKNQRKIMYKNNVDTIIIFTDKINIKEYDFSQYSSITPDMFSLFPNNYKLIYRITQEGFKKGVDGKTAVMTCTPINTGEKEENDNELVVMNTDGGNNMMSNSMLSSVLSTLIVTFVCLFAVPPVYFILINNNFLNDDERILYSVLIAGLLFILGTALILDGKGRRLDPYNQPMSGFIIILIVVLSYIGIGMEKEKLQDSGILNGKIVNGINTMMKKIGKMSWFLGFFNVCMLLFLVIFVEVAVKKNKLKPLKNKKRDYTKHLGDLIEGVGISYTFLFSIIFACMLTQPTS